VKPLRGIGRLVARLLPLAAVLAAAASPVYAQCAMCKTAVTSSPEGQVMGQHLNHAILMMVAAPYLVAGTVFGVLFRRQIAGFWSRTFRRNR
jgi:cytochrome c oxidase assembly factor CtaG